LGYTATMIALRENEGESFASMSYDMAKMCKLIDVSVVLSSYTYPHLSRCPHCLVGRLPMRLEYQADALNQINNALLPTPSPFVLETIAGVRSFISVFPVPRHIPPGPNDWRGAFILSGQRQWTAGVSASHCKEISIKELECPKRHEGGLRMYKCLWASDSSASMTLH
jgi:hypothetical protein